MTWNSALWMVLWWIQCSKGYKVNVGDTTCNNVNVGGIQTMSVWGRTTSIVACIWPPQNKSSIGKELNIKWPNGRNVQNMEQCRTSNHNHWRRLDQVNFAFLLYSKSWSQNPPLPFVGVELCHKPGWGRIAGFFPRCHCNFLEKYFKGRWFLQQKLSQPFAASCIKGKYWKSFQCHHRVLQVSTPTINCLPCNFFGDDICVLWWKMVVLSIDLLWMDHKLQKSSTIMPILGNPFKIWRHSIDFKRDRPTICFYCSNLLFRIVMDKVAVMVA